MANPTDLDEEDVVRFGGWPPRYARVVALVVDRRMGYGVAVIDGNGNGQELELETFSWNGTKWGPSFSRGLGPRNLGTDYLAVATAQLSRVAARS